MWLPLTTDEGLDREPALGNGGGVDVETAWEVGCGGCLATTGGSLAKTSLRMARKSRMVDLSQKLDQPTK